jgi:hypothetical protein
MQIERDDWQQKHGRKTVSGMPLFASPKHRKVQPVHPAYNASVDRAFVYAARDNARLHVKLLAILQTHRL